MNGATELPEDTEDIEEAEDTGGTEETEEAEETTGEQTHTALPQNVLLTKDSDKI